MQRIVVVYQPQLPATLAVAKMLATYLEERGTQTELQSSRDLESPPSGDLRLVVCLGGDGTVLRVARWLGGQPVPLLPVKMGTVNFLGELAPDDLPAGLEPYLAGDYWLDERAMLSVAYGTGERTIGLNDAVLARAQTPRAARIEVLVDQAAVACYLADAVIVSTATGSTAYSLAAGGPVLFPQSRSLVTTAVAAQLSALRSVVLPETAHVLLANRGVAPVVLSVDGQLERSIESSGTVDVAIAAETCSFARRGDRAAFYRGLAARLATGPRCAST